MESNCRKRFGGFAKSREGSLLSFLQFCKFIVQVAPLKYTKTCINIILYNFKNTIVSALNFNILKKNLSKIAYKEVKILCFSKLFSKNGICATVIICVLGFFVSLILIYYQTVLEIRKACQNSFAEL